MNNLNSTESVDIKHFIEEINFNIDRIISYFLTGYFFFGLFLAFFYDTWLVAAGVGSLCLLSFFGTKAILPRSELHRYVASTVLAIFMAQFIYQMHGMFEMHFFAFLGAVLLIAYQNWRLLLPLLTMVVLHHGSFAYLQYLGFKEIYFTQMDYMTLQAFIFHAAIAAAIVGVCGMWAYQLRLKTVENARNTLT
jgi:hypothetical protein